MKKAKTKHKKPVYGMWSNTCYMLKKAWNTRKSVIWLCLLSAILAVVSNLLNLYVTPSVLSLVEQGVSIQTLVAAILIFSGALMLTGALTAYINANAMYGQVDVRLKIVKDIHEKFITTSYCNLDNQEFLQKKDKANECVKSNDRATEAIWGTFKVILEHGIGFMIYLVLLSSVHWMLLIVTTITAIVSYVVGKRINMWQYQHVNEYSEYSNQMNYLGNMGKNRIFAKDIRIFGMGSWMGELYEKSIKMYDAFWARGERVRFLGNFVDIVLTLLRNGIAYGYLIWLVLENGLSASEFLLYFSAVGGFTTWITGILGDFSTLYIQSLDLSSMREYLDWEEPFALDGGKPLHLSSDMPCEIRLNHVTFQYPCAKKPTIQDMNLVIHPGEKLAVVGLNGAGKTTLVKLICGFYGPTEGEVLLNGVDIREYNRRDYYKHISAIFQDFSVVAASVEENVAQSVEHIDREKMKECVEKAGLTDVILRLPQQYETKLGKEVYDEAPELSGGEMQRLMLARTIYKEAPIMILDEPTAALDPIAESEMYEKYHILSEGRTSVYISHRLASTRFCDRILLLDNGGICEEGTHEELIQKKGKYAELFTIQSRYYKENIEEREGVL